MKPIVSYPKSGRTWLRYACTLAEIPEPEFTHAGVYTQAENIGEPWGGPPEGLVDKPIIFLHRNPIDTAISFYFQLLHKDVIHGRKTWNRAEERGIEMPPTDIQKFVLHPLYGVKAVCQYNRWWLSRLAEGSEVFRYEDFKKNPVENFERFFAALGHHEVDAKDIAERSSFERMLEVQDQPDGHKYRLTKPLDQDSGKVRRGVVGGYKDYLTSAIIKEARIICKSYKLWRL